MKGKIRVYARWRPLSGKEIKERQQIVLTAPDEFTVEHPWKDDKPKQHQYDHVFDHHATQEEVFEDTKVCVLNPERWDPIIAALLWNSLILVIIDTKKHNNLGYNLRFNGPIFIGLYGQLFDGVYIFCFELCKLLHSALLI